MRANISASPAANNNNGYQKAAHASIEDLYRDLATGEKGLGVDEVARRLKQYGPNIPPPGRKARVWERFLLQLKNWFNIMLLFAAMLSFGCTLIPNNQSSMLIGYSLVGVVIINAIFSLLQEYRAEKIVQTILKLIPKNAKVVRDGQQIEIATADLVPGDVIVLKEGDDVPADIRLIDASELSVNHAALTGESASLPKVASLQRFVDRCRHTELQNIIFAGTTIVNGFAKGIVLLTGSSTELSRIIALSEEAKEPLSSLQKEINHTASLNFIIALAVAMIFFGLCFAFINLTLVSSIFFAIGIMVSLVPEGLQLTVSLSLAITALYMSKRNVVLKRLSAVETLGAMSVLCVDKTGTLTSGEMMIEKAWISNEMFLLTGDGYNPAGRIEKDGREPDSREMGRLAKLFEVAAFSNNAKLSAPLDKLERWKVQGDPTDGAFLVFAEKGRFDVQKKLQENPRAHLISFNSARRIMTSINRNPDGHLTAYTKGAGKKVLERCTDLFMNDRAVPLTSEGKESLIKDMDEIALQGFRVLALATRRLESEINGNAVEDLEERLTFLGFVALTDPVRPKVKEAISEAKQAGIKVIMLTGDYELTAVAIAKKIGVISSSNYAVITGDELNKMDKSDLAKILQKKEAVFARIFPEQKLKIVQALKLENVTIGMTGDGVNDTPALIEADVGIAMGVGGTDVARESADIVLLDNNFISIINGIRYGRAGFENLRKFVGYIFTHNFAELGTFIAFILLGVPSLSVMQVLAIDLGLEVAPSLSLIMEPPEPGIMNNPPRKTNTLLDLAVLSRACYLGLLISIAVMAWAYFKYWHKAGWVLGGTNLGGFQITGYSAGTTCLLVGILGAQLGNLFASRTETKSALKLSLRRNRWLFLGVAVQILLMFLIVYVPFMQPLFQTAGLSVQDLLFAYALGPAIFLLEECRKLIKRHF